MPLEQLVAEAAVTASADSAVRAYDALRHRYFVYNERLFPNASSSALFRGNILLMRADTNGAAAAFREAIRRDSTNAEARGRLRAINRNQE